jgi:fatty-acyl-CoA synthase
MELTMSGTVRDETLSAFLDSLPQGEPAIFHEGRTLTFGQLNDASRRVGTSLVGLGVERGDRVGIWLPNIPEWLVLYLACARVGAIAVSVNTRFRSAEVEDIVGRAACKVLALWPGFKNIDFAGILAEVNPDALTALESIIVFRPENSDPVIPGRRTIDFDALLAAPPMMEDRGEPDSPCTIFTTSGTTGVPKFVLHGQRGITRHAREAAVGHGYLEEGARLLQILPFCGTFGLAQAMASFAAQRPVVLQTVFDAAEAVALGREYRVTHFNASDEMIARMLDATDDPRPLPDLRFCGFARFAGISGLLERAAARGVRMRGLYGMSECQALFALQPADNAERIGLAGGRPVSPAAAVRVCHPDTGTELPPGEEGEIQVRGPSVMQGYFQNPEATEKAFTDDGYLRTGDIGYATPDGGFVYTTRAGDALRMGGFMVAPAEIERYLERHPAVRTSAVVAGAKPGTCVAFVEPEPGAAVTEQELSAFCGEGLARFKVPARIYLLEELPTVPSANGAKIRRNLLREWAQRDAPPA